MYYTLNSRKRGLETTMRQQMQERLAGLKNEYEKGQGQLRQLESQSHALRETLMRISGAIMVLEELLSPSSVAPANGNQAELIKVDADPSATAQK